MDELNNNTLNDTLTEEVYRNITLALHKSCELVRKEYHLLQSEKLIEICAVKNEDIIWVVDDSLNEWRFNKLQNHVFTIEEIVSYYWGEGLERFNLWEKYNNSSKNEIEGIVLGMSYLQRGIQLKRLKRNTCCLAAPAQDLFYSTEMYKYVKHELPNLKYCIFEMNPYTLWYDMSKSKQNCIRSIYYIPQLGNTHNLESGEAYVERYKYLFDNYNQVFRFDLIIDWFEKIRKENHFYESEDLNIYRETDQNNVLEVKHLFKKEYIETYKENVEIFEGFVNMVHEEGVRLIIVIPPYPRVFLENMNLEMYEEVKRVINQYTISDDVILDLLNDTRFNDYYFSDWSHLNYFGANQMSDIINEEIAKLL